MVNTTYAKQLGLYVLGCCDVDVSMRVSRVAYITGTPTHSVTLTPRQHSKTPCEQRAAVHLAFMRLQKPPGERSTLWQPPGHMHNCNAGGQARRGTSFAKPITSSAPCLQPAPACTQRAAEHCWLHGHLLLPLAGDSRCLASRKRQAACSHRPPRATCRPEHEQTRQQGASPTPPPQYPDQLLQWTNMPGSSQSTGLPGHLVAYAFPAWPPDDLAHPPSTCSTAAPTCPSPPHLLVRTGLDTFNKRATPGRAFNLVERV